MLVELDLKHGRRAAECVKEMKITGMIEVDGPIMRTGGQHSCILIHGGSEYDTGVLPCTPDQSSCGYVNEE